ncbi:MAG: hypothetical protein GF344_03465 [Chitinivibrionales bacterium]|nr:hypothetical protein [Chitinivibrionales bacterium]MBD3356130.1 hypothetical protein [Chitinivibrionales bacterium]
MRTAIDVFTNTIGSAWWYRQTLVITVCALVSRAAEPNYVKTTTYASGKDCSYCRSNGPVTTVTHTDGLGRTLQSQTLAEGVSEAMVTVEEYDDAGRPFKRSRLFAHASDGSYITDGMAKANSALGDPAYSKTDYSDDPLSRPIKSAAPGASFIGHEVEIWYFGTVTSPSTGHTWLTEKGFVKESKLGDLSSTTDFGLSSPSHYLTITKDPNGAYTQEMADAFGRTVATWASPADGEEIIAEYEYDLAGNLLKEIPPGGELGPTTYVYNTLGQLVRKKGPDAEGVIYSYNKAGLLENVYNGKLTEEAKRLAEQEDLLGAYGWLVYHYDNHNRQVLTEVRFEKHPRDVERVDEYHRKVRTIYDNSHDAEPFIKNSAFTVSKLNALSNTRGRIAVQIAYGEECECQNEADEGECTQKVIEAFSYDNKGRVVTKMVSIPRRDLQWFFYTYDYEGKLVSRNYKYESNKDMILTIYKYDDFGRLEEIHQDGVTRVSYTYNNRGQLSEKSFYEPEEFAGPAYTVAYKYHTQRDWLTEITSTEDFTAKFKEKLYYEDAPKGTNWARYDGNITATLMQQKTASGTEQWPYLHYKYDNTSRLTNVTHEQYGSHSMRLRYGSTYDYKKDGRFDIKQDGTDQSHWGQYRYLDDIRVDQSGKQSSRLSGIDGVYPEGTWLYDANGNMTVDKAKNMVVTYDWRDLPVMFSFYDNIVGATYYEVLANIENNTMTRLSHVKMLYDAGGNRVMKQAFKN